MAHEECLAAVALKVAQDPQKEGLLRYLIDYEEKHAPYDWARDVSGGTADVSLGLEKGRCSLQQIEPSSECRAHFYRVFHKLRN